MYKLLILSSLITVVFSNVISYKLHEDNDIEINECVEKAIEALMEDTCLFFRIATPDEQKITFVQSTHCAWQASNQTVHLGTGCITDDVCLQLIGSMLDSNTPKSQISTHLNVKYNCTEKCTTVCENGGEIQDDCTCKCSRGFSGERCEDLTRQAAFTDSSCGPVAPAQSGVLTLSTYPDSRPKTIFCQWLIKTSDAWGIIDAEIDSLGLDDKNIEPNQNCNDFLTIYGTNDVKGTIPCDGSRNVTHVRSTSNWLLIELRTNPYSENSFTGPKIRYTVSRAPSAVHVFSEGMTAASAIVMPILSMILAFFYCF